jgi:ParB family protein of integrating conjugative element (PFGI_1 class)
MSKYPKRNLAEAMLQPGRQPATTLTGNVLPMGEMQMILTLDQLAPNPDNPRTTRNPRYDEIKASIRARGLDSVPKVTRDPDSDNDVYIFSDGGNTRFAILSELWQETGDERFYRINVVFKPWPGRLQCVIGHLAENEVRGDLAFIEKALGVRRARDLYEEEQGKVSVRKFAQLLTDDGMPLSVSSISRMMNTVDYLWPSMPRLLQSGLGSPQIRLLLALRQDAQKAWEQFSELSAQECSFEHVFAGCCERLDEPGGWSFSVFRDELIGDLVSALPHPSLNYDRWLVELTAPKKTELPIDNQQPWFAEVPSAAVEVNPYPSEQQEDTDKHASSPSSTLGNLRTEEQPDLYGADSIFSGDEQQQHHGGKSVGSANTFINADDNGGLPVGTDDSDNGKPIAPESTATIPASSPLTPSGWAAAEETILIDTDVEHLQSQAFRLAWAIADSRGYGDHIIPAREHAKAPGYRAADVTPVPVTLLLMSLTGEEVRSTPVNLNCIQGALFVSLFTGSAEAGEFPELDDENAQRLIQLLTVMRRLRELQRHAVTDDAGCISDDE